MVHKTLFTSNIQNIMRKTFMFNFKNRKKI